MNKRKLVQHFQSFVVFKILEIYLYSFPLILNIKFESFSQAVCLAFLHSLFKHFFSNFNVKLGRID
jgi:hypothetical protein